MPDIEQKLITDWLDESGYSWESVDQPEARFNIAFEYPRRGGGYTHALSLVPQSVVLMRGISVSEEHRQRLAELDFDGFAAFRFGLLQDLLRSGLQYRITGEAADSRMNDVLLQRDLWVEELTHVRFLHLAQQIHSMALLVMIHVRRAVGQMP